MSEPRDGPDRRSTVAPDTDDRFAVPLRGLSVDDATRCAHYDDEVDVIAFKFPCCDTYYPCFQCHTAASDHPPERRSRADDEAAAVLCGRCRTTLSVEAYLASDTACPACDAAFNPNCRTHHDRYFVD